MDPKIIIRNYRAEDRDAVRRISCDTAFLEKGRGLICDDDELLADFLTIYFTDHEPQSCFVAEADQGVVGYLIGARDIKAMQKILHFKIIPQLIRKSWRRGLFFRKGNLWFLAYCFRSFFCGEFFMPDFYKQFPATFHINIDRGYRGQGVGRQLVEQYLAYLVEQNVQGVQLATLSDHAKIFFTKVGLTLLFTNKRSYLRKYLGGDVSFYLFGKIL